VGIDVKQGGVVASSSLVLLSPFVLNFALEEKR
jgi:hypothetical protein